MSESTTEEKTADSSDHHAAPGSRPQQVAAPSAGEAMETAAKQYPSSATRLNLTLAYIDANAPGRAKPVLHGLLAQDPGNVAGWNNLCVTQVMLRELKDAIDDCNHRCESMRTISWRGTT